MNKLADIIFQTHFFQNTNCLTSLLFQVIWTLAEISDCGILFNKVVLFSHDFLYSVSIKCIFFIEESH